MQSEAIDRYQTCTAVQSPPAAGRQDGLRRVVRIRQLAGQPYSSTVAVGTHCAAGGSRGLRVSATNRHREARRENRAFVREEARVERESEGILAAVRLAWRELRR